MRPFPQIELALAGTKADSPAISLERVCKSFRTGAGPERTEVLRDISLQVPRGRFLAVIGPSGCGKTTLLRLIDGLLHPDSGSIRVFGEPPAPGPRIGYVFQSFRLIPWASVRSNVAFPLIAQGVSKHDRCKRVDTYLDLVGLYEAANAYPAQLSGGMCQRVALARALVTEPDILLMDEPFASVDALTRELLQRELQRLCSLREVAVVFVTHSIDEALFLGDEVALMGGRPACLLHVQEVPRPALPEKIMCLRSFFWNKLRELVIVQSCADAFGPQP